MLTGARDDGATGMRVIKQRGGIAIVQDPYEAPFPSMPMSVLRTVNVDYSLPLNDIPPLLNELSRQTVEEEEYPVPDEIEIESRIAQQNLDAAQSYGERLIAVILTGSGSDGAAGAVEVKNEGGHLFSHTAPVVR